MTKTDSKKLEEIVARLTRRGYCSAPDARKLLSKIREQDREIERLEKLYHKATEEISRAERYKGLERIRAEKAEAEAGQQRHLAKQNIMRARKVEARIKELEQEVLWAAEACEKAEAALEKEIDSSLFWQARHDEQKTGAEKAEAELVQLRKYNDVLQSQRAAVYNEGVEDGKRQAEKEKV